MMVKKGLTMKIALALLLATSATAAEAVTYNPYTGYSTASNPNGVYSYGYENTLGGSLTLFSTGGAANGQAASWTSPMVDQYLGVYKTATTILQHPGPSGQYSILRLTVPTTSTYVISGTFANGDNATTDVHVLTNGFTDFTGAIAGAGSSSAFSVSKYLAAGSTIDFAVGFGNGNYYNDSTLLDASIGTVPEPAAWMLMVTGFGLVGAVARRRAVTAAA
jgi:hypothetical protein